MLKIALALTLAQTGAFEIKIMQISLKNDLQNLTITYCSYFFHSSLSPADVVVEFGP